MRLRKEITEARAAGKIAVIQEEGFTFLGLRHVFTVAQPDMTYEEIGALVTAFARGDRPYVRKVVHQGREIWAVRSNEANGALDFARDEKNLAYVKGRTELSRVIGANKKRAGSIVINISGEDVAFQNKAQVQSFVAGLVTEIERLEADNAVLNAEVGKLRESVADLVESEKKNLDRAIVAFKNLKALRNQMLQRGIKPRARITNNKVVYTDPMKEVV